MKVNNDQQTHIIAIDQAEYVVSIVYELQKCLNKLKKES